MASTREEVKIRLGVDGSQVNAGLMGVRQHLNKFAADVPKKLNSLIKANVYAVANDALAKVAEVATDMWIKAIYGQSEAVAQARAKAAKDLATWSATVAGGLRDARDKFATASAKKEFADADLGGKLKILEAEEASLKSQIALTEELIYEKSRDVSDIIPTTPEDFTKRNKLIVEQGELQAGLLRSKTKIMEVTAAVEAMRKSINDAFKANGSWGQIGPNEFAPGFGPQPGKSSRKNQLTGQWEAWDPKAAPAEQATTINPMMMGVAGYYQKVAGQFAKYGAASEAGKYKAMGEAFYAAQAAAEPAQEVMSVRIVEIKD